MEKHPDVFVAYPLGLKGVVVGEGDTYEEALADVKSAIRFHVATFGKEVVPERTGRLGYALRVSPNHFDDPLTRPCTSLLKWSSAG